VVTPETVVGITCCPVYLNTDFSPMPACIQVASYNILMFTVSKLNKNFMLWFSLQGGTD
jgi:hypothetical protein